MKTLAVIIVICLASAAALGMKNCVADRKEKIYRKAKRLGRKEMLDQTMYFDIIKPLTS